jgi:hypothetical protein
LGEVGEVLKVVRRVLLLIGKSDLISTSKTTTKTVLKIYGFFIIKNNKKTSPVRPQKMIHFLMLKSFIVFNRKT